MQYIYAIYMQSIAITTNKNETIIMKETECMRGFGRRKRKVEIDDVIILL